MRLIFMGTPDFAVPSLDLLYKNGYDIVAVITSTDKMGGRGKKKVLESAVKKYAIEKGIHVLQPMNLKDPTFVATIRNLRADLQIVIAFRMLPEVIWNMPKHGTYNLHGSLLPKYRGAAPINWAVINGDKETGVTSFKLKHEIDTGDLLFQRKMRIYHDDNSEDVHDRMMILAAQVLLKTVKLIDSGEPLELIEQAEHLVSKAPKIFHKDCLINFDENGTIIYNFIRGMSPYPTAWTTINDKKIKVFATKFITVKHQKQNGTIVSDNISYLQIVCPDGYISIQELQIEGKRKMKIRDFLNGLNVDINQWKITQ